MTSLKTFVIASALILLPGVSASIDVKRWDTPLPSCVPYTPFVYVGCFSDPSIPSALIYRATQLSNTNMTVEVCVDFCKGNGYRYAGLEYYGECFCGASVNGPQIAESNCVDPCAGNQTQACGGTDIISVYMDPTFPNVTTTTIGDYKPQGCYSEGTNGRALAWQQDQLSTTNLTIEECLFACKAGGYSFAGVEYATQCFCGVALGNGSIPDDGACTMPCTGDSTETCGGPGALDLYVATDLESTQPCGYVPPPPPPPSTTPTPTPTPSLCTSTVTVSPTPTCEYKCGKWCSNPLPPFSDQHSCGTAASNCAVQVASCFLNAGWPDSMNCFKYSDWCSNIGQYCSGYCPGGSCSLSKCKGKYPPSGPSVPSPTVSTSIYTCSSSAPSTTSKPTSSSCVPVPTSTCICKQPHNPSKGYSSTSPVGSIKLPCLTCNNLRSDYNSGNWFKLYTSSDTKSCPSYGKSSIPQGCKSSCDNQYSACLNTYAQSCKGNSPQQIAQGADSYNSASTKCQNQWNDCHDGNSGASAGNLCNSWNSGWL